MSGVERRAFSLGWMIVAYCTVLGGIGAAFVVAAALEIHERTHVYGAIAAGAAVGGIFAGRASPHRSFLEPAIAGALVVGSVIAFMSQTAPGKMIYAFAQDAMWREAAICGGAALGGGLIGAIVGEISAPAQPSGHPVRWIGMAILITGGTLLASAIVSNVLLVDRALREGGAVEVMVGRPLVTDDELARAFLVALGAGALFGGLVTQAAAPRRLLLTIGVAVILGYAAMLLAIIDPFSAPASVSSESSGSAGSASDSQTLIGIAVIAVAGGVLAMIGGVVGRIVSRAAP